jgi:hypothetical protein
MVPIYRDRIMVGVLEILFNKPHIFEEPELRTYQLMATLAGDASALRVQGAEERPVAPSSVPHALWKITSELQQLGNVDKPAVPSVRPSWSEAMYAKMSAVRDTAMVSRVSELRRSTIRRLHGVSLPPVRWPHISLPKFRWPRSAFQKGNWRRALEGLSRPLRPLRQRRWYVAAVAVVVMTVVFGSIARHHGSVSRLTDSSQPASPAFSPTSSTSTQPLLAGPAPKPQPGTGRREANAPNASFKRVPMGKNEVDYVADDVTIRQFRSPSQSVTAQRRSRQVKIGEDVTVRYFNSPQSLPQAKPASVNEESLRD